MSTIKAHDKFIDQVFSDPSAVSEFMRELLPSELSSRIDFSSIRIKKGRKTSGRYRRYNLDFIVTGLLDKEETEFYFVIEHKSSPEKDALIQALGYNIVTYEEDMRRERKLRPIISIIFYHGKEKWRLPLRFEEYFDISEDLKEYILRFKYVLIDLSRYENKDFLEKLERNVRLY